MAIESKTYDCIIPLGSGCAVANQLKLRGLRKYSLPFDWVAIIDDEWLLQSVESIETHFKFWLNRETVRTEYRAGDGLCLMYDDGAQRVFPHDFYKSPIDDNELVVVQKKYDRRIKRLYDVCDKAHRILFIFAASHKTLSMVCVKEAYERLCIFFPYREIDFFVLAFDAPTYGSETAVMGQGNIFYSSVQRKMGEYDLNKSPAEWAWLDDVRLSSVETIQAYSKAPAIYHSRYEKMVYKFYKHLKKWLMKRGVITFHYDD